MCTTTDVDLKPFARRRVRWMCAICVCSHSVICEHFIVSYLLLHYVGLNLLDAPASHYILYLVCVEFIQIQHETTYTQYKFRTETSEFHCRCFRFFMPYLFWSINDRSKQSICHTVITGQYIFNFAFHSLVYRSEMRSLMFKLNHMLPRIFKSRCSRTSINRSHAFCLMPEQSVKCDGVGAKDATRPN